MPRPARVLPAALVALAAVSSALLVPPARAQEGAAAEPAPTLSTAVAATALELRLVDGRLVGPGADWLRQRAAGAAAVVVGESHGVAEVPALVAALLADLRPLGFGHLAIETGPLTAELVESLLRREGEAYEELLRRQPFGVPFYGWRPEAELLRAAVAAGGAGPVLWGIDQEFVLSTPIHLEALRGLAGGDERAAAAVDELLARPMPPGAPLQAHPLALTSLSGDDLSTLAAAFGSEPPPDAARILDALAASHEVYRLFMAGENYRSNLLRAQLLRRNLLAHYRAAESAAGAAPRFVAKLGLSHVHRGRSPNNAFDVGNLALALADEQGRRSLNLGVVCGPGSRAAGFGPGPGADCDEPFAALAVPAGRGWLLYDLEAVRPDLHAHRLTVDDADLERLVWALDAAVVLPAATPAAPLAAGGE